MATNQSWPVLGSPPALALSLRPSGEEHVFLERLANEARVIPKWDRALLAALEADADTPERQAAVRALRSIYYVASDRPRELLDRLRGAAEVLDVHERPRTGAPSFVAALQAASIVTPAFVDLHQTHLDPAPVGINARYAWQHEGGGGGGVHMYIMEGAWSRLHPELRALQIHDLDAATPADAAIGIAPLASVDECPAGASGNALDHGAKVLSLLFAPDQKPASCFDESGFASASVSGGVTGLVPYVSRIAIGTQHDASQAILNGNKVARVIAAAIASAKKNPTVLLVERQIEGASKEGLGAAWKNVVKPAPSAVPFDSTLETYIDFVAAVQFGVHVIMPLANGSDQTLDGTEYALDKVYAALAHLYKDTFGGAPEKAQPIRVAAARRVEGAWKYNDPEVNTQSNYARAADCFGPAPVLTTDRSAVTAFTQTSGASAVIAGAAASILGRAYAKGIRISPDTLRHIFRNAANGQRVEAASPEQVLPDLANIFRRELRDRAPDLYLRKATEPPGPSPDLIIHPISAGAAPPTTRALLALYGDGRALGPRSLTAGERYAISARVRNRGSSMGRNVLVRIFSAPLSPLSIGDRWEYVGSSWMFNVRTGRVPVLSPPVIWTAPRSGHASFIAEVTCGGDNPQPDRKSVSTWEDLLRLAQKNDNLAFRSVAFAPIVRRDRVSVGEGTIHVFGLLPSAAKLSIEVESNVPRGSSISVLAPPSFVQPGAAESWIRLELDARGRARLVERAFTPAEQHPLHFRVEIPTGVHRERCVVAVLQKHGGVEAGRAFIYFDPLG